MHARQRTLALSLAGAVAFGALAEPAAAQIIRSEYAVSLYGLVLARSNFESTIDGDGFKVSGSLSSAGIGAIFDDTRGTTSVRGRFSGGASMPESYVVDYVSGSKKKSTRIAFSGGDVVSAENVPPVNTKRDGWLPVAKDQLARVADPISATLVRADSPDAVCGRTLRVFDGAMRADLQLTATGSGEASIPGYEGQTVTCSAKFIPIAGYRKGHRSIEYLKNASAIAIAFAPIGTTGVYAPIEASVSTQIGTIRVRAERFETVN